MSAGHSLQDQIKALNNHDVDAFVAFYASDAIVNDPQQPEPLKGLDSIRNDITDLFGAFPDLTFTIKNSLESGDIVAFEGTGKATHTGPMAGPDGEIPPTNKPVDLRFAAFLRINDQGLIVEERRYRDFFGMMAQLGLAA